MGEDIVTRLRRITAKPLGLVLDPPPHPLCKEAADEIERLRALTAEQALVHDAWLTERSLADQLAVALAAQGSASFDEDTNLNIKRLALDAFKEARREQ